MIPRLVLELLAPYGARHSLSVLIFHSVLERPDPLFPGDPDAARFEEQLSWVKEWFSVIPLADAVTGLSSGRLPPRPLSITFDDGYADNCTVALPILRRLGLHATFFVAAGYLNGGRMWNDTIIQAIRSTRNETLDLTDLDLGQIVVSNDRAKRTAIDALLPQLKYLPHAERCELAEEIASRAGARLTDDLMLSDAQVRELHCAGMTIGAHTVLHPILARVDDNEARREIAESRGRLEAIVGDRVSLFAYPNGEPGRDYTRAHVAMVRELGFDAAVTTAPGAARAGCDPHQIPRFTPWDRGAFRYVFRLAQNARRPDYAVA
jgi:peptidoglycan/xylan/chitin deacetylase (PgdA/CDA1 family)